MKMQVWSPQKVRVHFATRNYKNYRRRQV